VFLSALSFATSQDSRLMRLADSWDENEAFLARQITLLNLGRLYLHTNDTALAEHFIMLSLTSTPIMHLNSSNQAVNSLFELLQQGQPSNTYPKYMLLDGSGGQKLLRTVVDESSDNQTTSISPVTNSVIAQRFVHIAKQNEIIPMHAVEGSGAALSGIRRPKRVVFALDYSGSMAGSKIKSAVSSLQEFIASQLTDEDELSIILFNGMCSTVLPLVLKGGNQDLIQSVVASLNRPTGGTALYDAIIAACKAAATTTAPEVAGGEADAAAGTSKPALQPGGGGERCANRFGLSRDMWSVILTDGMEGGSNNSKKVAADVIRHFSGGFVIIGVGTDVDTAALQLLVGYATTGHYVTATSDLHGIEAAFHKVGALIHGQVLLEEV
jgi:hypothetical protein